MTLQTKDWIYMGKLVAIILSIALLQAHTLLADGSRATMVDAYTKFESATAQEILWLARVIYSESKVKEEQIIVAWVVRNRVESQFRGEDSYEAVARDPGQFSGLNPGDAQYKRNMKLSYIDTKNQAWQNSIEIARAVYFAPESLRPISETVRHFYSPTVVTRDPNWANGKKPTLVLRDSEKGHVRFAFYDSIR